VPVSIFTLFSAVSSGSALVSFSTLYSKEGYWRLSKSLLYCLLCMLVPLSSPFLLYVQRNVLGACQNRLWFRSLLLFTPFCLKNVLSGCLNIYYIVFLIYLLVPLSSPFLLYVQITFLAPVKIVFWFLSGLLFTPFCLKNFLGGCLNLYSIILSSISSPFLSFIVNGTFFATVSIC
jgi:hypothetical protein